MGQAATRAGERTGSAIRIVPEGARRRRTVFLATLIGISISAALFGSIAGFAVFPMQPLRGAAFGFFAGLVPGLPISALIVGAELYLPRTRAGRWLDRAPFLLALTIKSVAYTGIVILIVGSRIGRWVSGYVFFGSEFAQQVYQWEPYPLAVPVGIALLLMPTAVFFVQMAGLVGSGTLVNIALGRYHRSRIEERFFLFIDIVGSTPLAERLGPASVHDFLNRVFHVASDPIEDHAGDVYQYVGDEMIITWTLAQGRQHARPIACYFAIQRELDRIGPDFQREFGTVPRLRAALHAGPVITGEVGGSRRAIVFHGDVMNTTSRIEQATRDLHRSFLVSGDAVDRITEASGYRFDDLGPQHLRGREAVVRVYAVEPIPARSDSGASVGSSSRRE